MARAEKGLCLITTAMTTFFENRASFYHGAALQLMSLPIEHAVEFKLTFPTFSQMVRY